MFSPKLYSVYKFPFLDIVKEKLNICNNLNTYLINQQDNSLFRQVRLITNDYRKFNQYIVFVDCRGYSSNQEDFSNLIHNGFCVKGRHFELCERSASMTRQGILSFVDSGIQPELDKRITMDIDFEETVLSKYVAYRGLMFSSCHCLEDWYPKIIVVPDGYRTIKNQLIKYVYDKESPFIDNETSEERIWKEKSITSGVKDIEINMFDGAGIHHPSISKEIQQLLSCEEIPTSILWRAPFIKGVSHSIDYTSFFLERGVTEIEDIWKVKHSVRDKMIIMSESMYKGYKYFKHYNDYQDWEEYWRRFKKYQHCIGIAKWNFTKEEEPVYTRGNYQILQDLDLTYEQFALLAKDSVEWANKIIDGDKLYTYCFLGLLYNSHNPMNEYMKAILKNPMMINEKSVREYIINLLKKMIREFKCGKLWLKGCFKILAPDLIAFMEHIGGLNPQGCLNADEFYSNSKEGEYEGEFLIERNPHICRSEHTILSGHTSDVIRRYCGHLSNVCMVNSKSLVAQRLNGAD